MRTFKPGARLGDAQRAVTATFANRVRDVDLLFFAVGTNDLGKLSREEFITAFRELLGVARVAAPHSVIAFSSIIPRPRDHEITGPMILVINADLKRLCQERDVWFVDTFDLFTHRGSPKRNLFQDGIHLAQAGVRHLKDFLRQQLNDGNVRRWLQQHASVDEE